MEIKGIDINNERPVFIAGSKRGGTTLLRRIINAHSMVCIPPPGWFYFFIYPHVYSYGDLTQQENILELIRDCVDIPVVKKYWDITETPEEILSLIPERSFRGVLTALFRVYARRYNARMWGSKTPGDVFWLKEMQDDFPGAKFLLLYRDGRDVSMDLVDVSWGPTNLYTAGLLWQSYVQAILKGKKLLKAGSYHEIYYEKLVKKPEEVVRSTCDFLELEFEPGMLRYYEKSADTFMKHSYHQKTNMPITGEFAGMYKTLPPTDRRLLAGIIGSTLEELGYEVENAPREIGFWERERYLEEDRHGGMILEGGVEFKHALKEKRVERHKKGIWTENDRSRFYRGFPDAGY